MKRRHLLQLAGTTLTTLGLSTLQIKRQGLQYARTLAQPTHRKRALLVGINHYPRQSLFTNLKGCVKDVELQEQLLRHRFGFTDIETLVDEQATRDNILTTFEEFLIKPCQEDDVVVFHFSGHGRRVLDPDGDVAALIEGDENEPLNSSIVPADDESGRNRDKVVSDIMGRTLFLLTSALKTPNVTIVLDSCYAGGGIRGDTRVRSADPNDPNVLAFLRSEFEFRASQAELEYQDRWISQLNLTPKVVKQQRDIGIAKGIAIASARGNQKAVDASFDQFHAGAFTYFLTQYLWHEADSIEKVITNVTVNLNEQDFTQKPVGCLARVGCDSSQVLSQPQPAYFVDPRETDATPAEAVLLENKGSDRGTIWLGGSTPNSLNTYGIGAQFIPIGADGTRYEPVTVLRRNSLEAEVKLNQPLPVGTRLVEATRVILRNLKLRIGLDPSLEDLTDSIDQDIVSWDTGDRFELVRPQAADINGENQYTYGEGEIHYILSRLTPEYRDFLLHSNREALPESEQPDLPESDSIVLLSPGIESIVPGFAYDKNQPISSVISELKNRLLSLRNAKNLKQAINTRRTWPANNTERDIPSHVRGTGPVSEEQIVRNLLINITVRIRVFDGAECRDSGCYLDLSTDKVAIPLGVKFQFEISNHEADEVYLSITEVAPSGEITALLPINAWDETNIYPNHTRIVPEPHNVDLNGNSTEFYIDDKIKSKFLISVMKKAPVNPVSSRRDELATVILANLGGVDLSQRSANNAEKFSISMTDAATFTIPFEVVDS